MKQDATRLGGTEAGVGDGWSDGGSGLKVGVAGAWRPEPRVRRADRAQMLMQALVIDELLASDHPARMIEAVVGKLNLSAYYDAIEARGEQPGRPATDPAMLITLLIYAATENIGCGREIERRCQSQDAFRWICGGVSVCYKVITEFRVAHERALDDLFTQVLAALVRQGVVGIERISQDGTKVKASAGSSSFHRRKTTEDLLVRARAHVEKLKEQLDPAEAAKVTAAQKAARERGAREKAERLERTLVELGEMEAGRAKWARGKDKKYESRSSSTDPEARNMKMGDGGMRPAYNVQVASDPASRAIVGVEVCKRGVDNHLDAPMREQIRRRVAGLTDAAGKPLAIKEHLLDGGYAGIEDVEAAKKEGVTLYVPPREREPGPDVDPKTGTRPSDPPEVVEWRARMSTEEAKAIYGERGKTSETINADLKTFRGLSEFRVRGLGRVRCVALWSALAYNIMHFGSALMA
jgi:transposase